MKRKAQISTTAKLIILLASASLILLFAGLLSSETKDKVDLESCRTSVRAASEFKHITSISACKTRKHKIIEVDKSQTKELQKTKAMEQIGDLMKNCWYQFADGTKDPWAGAQTSFPVHCFKCSSFELPKDFNTITTTELTNSLKKDPYFNTLKKGFISSIPEEGVRDLYLLDSLKWDEGQIFLFNNPEFDSIIYEEKIYPNQEYEVIFWNSPARWVRQYLKEAPLANLLVVTKKENLGQLSCSYLHQTI